MNLNLCLIWNSYSMWDLSSKQSKTANSQRGVVKRLQFAHSAGDYTLIALHADGIAIWNVAKFTCLQSLAVPRDLASRIVDAALCANDNLPVLLTADGSVRLFDRGLAQQSAPIPETKKQDIFCPGLLPPSISWLLKTVLIDSIVQKRLAAASGNLPDPITIDSLCSSLQLEGRVLRRQLESMDPEILSTLLDPKISIVTKALITGRLFGDEYDIDFWSVVRMYLPNSDDVIVDDCYELFQNLSSFKKLELMRCAAFDARRSSHQQLSEQSIRLQLVSLSDEAVQILLDADPSRPDYYEDCLRACLYAAMHDSTECQSTVKLVATSLIANGRLTEGVQLLNLIKKYFDACRYLQSNNEWYKAAWLAKLTLEGNELYEILKKWAENLCSAEVSAKNLAILIFVSLKQWEKVLEILVSSRQFTTAAWLFLALERQMPEFRIDSVLLEACLGEYARELNAIGLSGAALEFCDRAGERGKLLREEIRILSEDKSSSSSQAHTWS